MEEADGVEVVWRELMVWRWSEGADGVEVEWRELMMWRWSGGS